MSMSVTERRWREGLGVQYLKDGFTVRCQGVSKTKLRARREETGNFNLSSDDVWPELQCMRSVIVGTFACRFHGGKSLNIKKTDITEYIPINLKDKMDLLKKNPDYLSRKKEMLAIQSRFWDLLSEMEGMGGMETWERILDAADMIAGGDITKGIEIIKETAGNKSLEREHWKEARETAKLLETMSRTEVANMRELKDMITDQQLINTLDSIFTLIGDAVETYIKDEDVQKKVLLDVSTGIRKLINAIS